MSGSLTISFRGVNDLSQSSIWEYARLRARSWLALHFCIIANLLYLTPRPALQVYVQMDTWPTAHVALVNMYITLCILIVV